MDDSYGSKSAGVLCLTLLFPPYCVVRRLSEEVRLRYRFSLECSRGLSRRKVRDVSVRFGVAVVRRRALRD
jgi:hypothetical protein